MLRVFEFPPTAIGLPMEECSVIVDASACLTLGVKASDSYLVDAFPPAVEPLSCTETTWNPAPWHAHQITKNEPPTIASRTSSGEPLRMLINDFMGKVQEQLQSLPASVLSEAKNACMRIARVIVPLLIFAENLRYAAFDEDGGGLSLTFHSRTTRRQVTFEVANDGRRAIIVTIDEDLQRNTWPVQLDTGRHLGEPIQWLIRAA